MKISARDIQLLVAGAFASTGFFALVTVPYYIFPALNGFQILSHIITGIELLLGIGIFVSYSRAVLFSQIYLWILLIGDIAAIPVFYQVFPSKASHMLLNLAPGTLLGVILLALLYWSRSRRFHPPNTALEPTPTAP